MSIMIRVSYQKDNELEDVINHLDDFDFSVEVPSNQHGLFKRAYLKEHPKKPIIDFSESLDGK